MECNVGCCMIRWRVKVKPELDGNRDNGCVWDLQHEECDLMKMIRAVTMMVVVMMMAAVVVGDDNKNKTDMKIWNNIKRRRNRFTTVKSIDFSEFTITYLTTNCCVDQGLTMFSNSTRPRWLCCLINDSNKVEKQR